MSAAEPHLDLAHLRALCHPWPAGPNCTLPKATLRALLDRLERAEAAWLYLGDRLLGRDEVSDGELRGLCGGHHVGGPAFCDRCGDRVEELDRYARSRERRLGGRLRPSRGT